LITIKAVVKIDIDKATSNIGAKTHCSALHLYLTMCFSSASALFTVHLPQQPTLQ